MRIPGLRGVSFFGVVGIYAGAFGIRMYIFFIIDLLQLFQKRVAFLA